MNVMIDIETLGTEPGCSIASIGAVKFAPGRLGEQFHRSVSLVSCESAGLEIDADTLDWWLRSNDHAREVLAGGDELEDVLEDFTEFVDEDSEVWANAPSFDCKILARAYDAVGMDVPWAFWNERCFRTLKNLSVAVDVDHDGTKHDALDDAVHQAHVASATLAEIDRNEDPDK